MVNAFKRFPIVIGCGLLATICLILANHFYDLNITLSNFYFKIGLEAFCGGALFFSFALLYEKYKFDVAKKIGFIVLGFCFLSLHYFSLPEVSNYLDWFFIIRFIIIFCCFHLLISFIIYNSADEILFFWQFNVYILERFFISFLFSILFFIGISSALLAIEKLFNVSVSWQYYIDIFIVLICFINTLFFIKGLPTDFSFFEKPIDYKRSLLLFIQFVLFPILGIYFIILYSYLIKIVVYGKLPNAWVLIPILFFSMLGLLIYFLIYPLKNYKEKSIFTIYNTYYFYILFPILALFFAIIYQNILDFGFTEMRYLALAIGVWILFVSLYALFSKDDNIIVYPISLFIILLLSSIGPFGMFQVSELSQKKKLNAVLVKNNVLKNDKFYFINNDTLNIKNEKQIASILKFLISRNYTKTINHWLEDKDAKIMDSIFLHQKNFYFQYLINHYVELKSTKFNQKYLNFSSSNELEDIDFIDVASYKTISIINLEKSKNLIQKADFSFSLDNNNLIIKNNELDSLGLNINNFSEKILLKLNKNKNNILQSNLEFLNLETQHQDMIWEDSLKKHKIIFINIGIEIQDAIFASNKLSFYFLSK